METSEILTALFVGFIFGFALDKGGLNRYHKIANVFRYTDLTVLRFMMTGMLVGMVGIYTLKYLGVVDFTPIAPAIVGAQLIGGAIFGIGMAVAGFCPGTCIAGSARGQLDYAIPGALGFLTGGLIYGLIYPTDFIQSILTAGRFDQAYARLPEILGVDPMLLMFVFAEAVLIFVYVLAKTGIARRDKLAAETDSANTATPAPVDFPVGIQPSGAGD